MRDDRFSYVSSITYRHERHGARPTLGRAPVTKKNGRCAYHDRRAQMPGVIWAQRADPSFSATSENFLSKGFPMSPQYGPLPSSKGSELWAPSLKVADDDDVIVAFYRFRIRGPY